MKYDEVMGVNARSGPKKGAKPPEIHTLEHSRSSNGGHVFTHRFNNAGAYHEPEIHTFGKDEGKQALAHFAKHAGISEELPKADPDSAAGAAT